jgi:hypothetical protein
MAAPKIMMLRPMTTGTEHEIEKAFWYLDTPTGFKRLQAAKVFGTCTVIGRPGKIILAAHMHALQQIALDTPANMLTLSFCLFKGNSVLLFSKDTQQHREHLKKLITMLELSRLDINERKTTFYKASAREVGFDVRGIDRLVAQEFPVPEVEQLVVLAREREGIADVADGNIAMLPDEVIEEAIAEGSGIAKGAGNAKGASDVEVVAEYVPAPEMWMTWLTEISRGTTDDGDEDGDGWNWN